jgi:hypothetical protein
MNILLTGARAPVALDLARRLHAAGHAVFMADSLRFGMGMFSRVCQRRFVLPRPSDSPLQYLERLKSLIEKLHIELLIPTCEEVFTLSRYRDELPCDLLSDDIARLTSLHDKFVFSQMAGNDFASTPETRLMNSTQHLLAFQQDIGDDLENWVFKPVYSRFASRTMVGPTTAELIHIHPSDSDPWVAQRRIFGQEFSTYSVAREGQLMAHACYSSVYRAGKGAGICFHSCRHERILNFVRQFVERFHFRGQIGFDLIETVDGEVFVLEANPRATSGVHLFDNSNTLADVLTGRSNCFVEAAADQMKMVEFAMPIWGVADSIRRKRFFAFLQDCCRAKSITFSWRDPMPTLLLPLSLVELAWIAVRERRTLQEASTFDIEWNGGHL